jgi:eukaryotic-like serine/threonine-protein kinase
MITTSMHDGPDPPGDSLRDRFEACRREGLPGIPVPELLRYIAEVARDLDARGQPHGNVKPDTIRLAAGHARLDDDAATGPPPDPESGTIAGTPAYMAPEVWEGKQTARSDQYALACTYAELRTGRPPFPGSGLAEVMRAHLESPPDLEGCTDAEQQILARALSKAAQQRFPNCRELAEQLARAVATGA